MVIILYSDLLIVYLCIVVKILHYYECVPL